MSEERIRSGSESSINLLRILCKRILDDSSASVPRRLSKEDESVDRLYLQLSHNEFCEADNASISKTEPSVIWSAVLHFIITHIPAPLSSNLTDRDSESLITIAAMSATFKKAPSYLQKIYASLLCTIEIIVSEYENSYKDMVDTLCIVFLGHKFTSPRMNARNHPYILLNIMREYRNYFSYTSLFSRKVGGVPTCDVEEWKRALSIQDSNSTRKGSNEKDEEEDDYLEPMLSSPQRAPLDPTTKAYPSPGSVLMGLDAYLAGMTPNKNTSSTTSTSNGSNGSNGNESKSGVQREGEEELSLADNTLSAPSMPTSVTGPTGVPTGGGMGGSVGWDNLTDDDTSALINLRNNDYIDYDEDEDDSVNSDDYARMRSPQQRGLTGMQRRKMERMMKAQGNDGMSADPSSGKKLKRKKKKGKKGSKKGKERAEKSAGSSEMVMGGEGGNNENHNDNSSTGILRRLRTGSEAKGATGSNVRFASQLERFQDSGSSAGSDSARLEAKAAGMGVYSDHHHSSTNSINVHVADTVGGVLEDDSGSGDSDGSEGESGSNDGSDSGDELTSTDTSSMNPSPAGRSYYAQLRQARGMPSRINAVATAPAGNQGLGGSMALEDDSDDSADGHPSKAAAEKERGESGMREGVVGTKGMEGDGEGVAHKLAGKHVLGSIEDDEDEDGNHAATNKGNSKSSSKSSSSSSSNDSKSYGKERGSRSASKGKDGEDDSQRKGGARPERLSAASIPRRTDAAAPQRASEDASTNKKEKSGDKDAVGEVSAANTRAASANPNPNPNTRAGSAASLSVSNPFPTTSDDNKKVSPSKSSPPKDLPGGASGTGAGGADSTPASRREAIRKKYLNGTAGSNVSSRRSGGRGTISADKAGSLTTTTSSSTSNIRSSRALSRQLVFGDDDEDLNLEMYTTKSKASKEKQSIVAAAATSTSANTTTTAPREGGNEGKESTTVVDLDGTVEAEDGLAGLVITDIDDSVAVPVDGGVSPVGPGADSTLEGRARSIRSALSNLQSSEVLDRLSGNSPRDTTTTSSSSSSSTMNGKTSKSKSSTGAGNDSSVTTSQDSKASKRTSKSKSKPDLTRASREIKARSESKEMEKEKEKEKREKGGGRGSADAEGDEEAKSKGGRGRSPIVRPASASAGSATNTATGKKKGEDGKEGKRRSGSTERDNKDGKVRGSEESKKVRKSADFGSSAVKMREKEKGGGKEGASSSLASVTASKEGKRARPRSPKGRTTSTTSAGTTTGADKEDVKNGSTVRRSRATRKSVEKPVSASQDITLPPPPPRYTVNKEDLQDATTVALYTALDAFPNIFTTHTRLPSLSPYARQTGVIIEGKLDKKSAHGLGMWGTSYWVLSEDPVDFVVLKRFKRSLSTAYGDVPQEQMMQLPVSMVEDVYARVERDARADPRDFIVNISTVPAQRNNTNTQRNNTNTARKKPNNSKGGNDSDDDYSIPSVDSKQSNPFGKQENIQMVMRAGDGEERQLWTTFISLCRNFVLDLQD